MEFANLVDHPEFFPLVARWNWEEWSCFLVERSAEEFETWLRQSVQRNAIPMTLLAIENGRVNGTVSLVEQDLELGDDTSPWVASLYVVPEHRGRGLGRALVNAAAAEARRIGFDTLYLYTPDHEEFYAALGWSRVRSLCYRRRMITIMQRKL